MRYVVYILLAVIAAFLVVVASANTEIVTLTLIPSALDTFLGVNPMVGSIQLPLYLVVLGGVVVGLILGFFWEYARESQHRRAVRLQRQENARLNDQVRKMKARENAGKDDVLLMVEETARSR